MSRIIMEDIESRIIMEDIESRIIMEDIERALMDIVPMNEVELGILTETLQSQGCVITTCGSRVTCDPPPMDADRDFLVVAPSGIGAVSTVVETLQKHGFTWEGDSEHYQNIAASDFMSWRRDDVNLIVTASQEFARRHVAATGVCRLLNLMDKSHRVALFQAVLYGNAPDAGEENAK
jgi:hypothetical protein